MNKLISYIFNSKSIRIIAFVIVFILATTYIFSSSIKSNSDTKLDSTLEYLEKNKNVKFDIFFFGNSHIFTSIDPLLLKALTGSKSIHFGTSARRLCFEPFIIEEVFKISKPKLIVLDISGTTTKVPESEEIGYYNEKPISSFNLSLNKINQIEFFKDNPNQVLLRTSSSFTNTMFQLTVNDVFDKKRRYGNGGVLGFVPRLKQYFKDKISYKAKFDSLHNIPMGSYRISKTIDNKTLGELDALIEYFKNKKDINLLFVNSIKINSIWENDTFMDLLKQKIEGVDNINILVLNSEKNKKNIGMKFEDFSDQNHPSLTGAYKITNFFSSYIKQNYPSFKSENSNNNYVFTDNQTDGKISIKNVQVLLEKGFDQDIRIVIDSIDSSFLDYNTVITIVPKPKYTKYLSKYSKKKGFSADKEYLYIKDYAKVGKYLVGRFNMKSKLKKEQIDHIELSFWNGKTKQGTNKVTIEI